MAFRGCRPSVSEGDDAAHCPSGTSEFASSGTFDRLRLFHEGRTNVARETHHQSSPAEELARIAATGDPIQQWVRDTLGKSLQLRVPIRDVADLRRCATILRTLASRMDVAGMDRTKDTAMVFFEIHAAFRLAQAQLQSRPKAALSRG